VLSDVIELVNNFYNVSTSAYKKDNEMIINDADLVMDYEYNKMFKPLTLKIGKYKLRYLDNSAFDIIYELCIKNLYHFHANDDTPRIIDCGSNIGLSIAYFKLLYPKSTILGFEPCKSTYHCLKYNRVQNLWPDVDIHNVGLSDHDGSATIYFNHDCCGGSSIKGGNAAECDKEEIQLERLSPYINERVVMLKIDTEGSEYEILKDLHDADKLKFVDNLIIEIHLGYIGYEKFNEILAILLGSGFKYYFYSLPLNPFKSKNETKVNMMVYAQRTN
jgi:FkbM family methyltransferase